MGDERRRRPEGYARFLSELRARVQAARTRAVRAVQSELVLLYWSIGQDILERQERHGWGAGVIEQLASDLRRAFPDSKGFSARNLLCMRRFAQAWPSRSIVQQLVAELPWGHNVRLLEKLEDDRQRLWYAQQAVAHGWSRAVLTAQIERGLFSAQGGAVTDFADTPPGPTRVHG